MYLALLCVALGSMFLIDYRWKLFWFDDARAAALTTGVMLTFFLIWDLIGISSGIFFIGETQMLLGITIAPNMPVEEPIFLLLLVHSAMVLWAAGRRFIEMCVSQRNRTRTRQSHSDRREPRRMWCNRTCTGQGQ